MTPLQQAATALMDAMVQTDFTCRLGEQLDALEKALEAEQAQATRTALEQYDLDQSADYKKGWNDGRIKGYEVGHRYATEAKQAQAVEPVKRWPFDETPGEFTSRLQAAHGVFGSMLAAVRFVLIEEPPVLTHPAPPAAETMKNGAHRWINLDLLGAIAGALHRSKNAPIILSKVRGLIKMVGGVGRGLDAPYPGMIEAFEAHYGQSFTDKDWRNEAGIWAAAWRCAVQHPAQPAGEQIDWQDMYLKQKSEKEAMAAKYERDIGPLARMAPSVTGERAELICRLSFTADASAALRPMLIAAIDMLEADAKAQQVAVPLTDNELDDLLPTNSSLTRTDAMRWTARAVERHHGIGAKP